MHISSFKPWSNDTIDDYQEEKERRQDIENLTVEDFIDALVDTIDKDTTVDMILQNMEQAQITIQEYKRDRIREILFMKYGFEYLKEEQEQKQKESDTVEVKA